MYPGVIYSDIIFYEVRMKIFFAGDYLLWGVEFFEIDSKKFFAALGISLHPLP